MDIRQKPRPNPKIFIILWISHRLPPKSHENQDGGFQQPKDGLFDPCALPHVPPFNDTWRLPDLKEGPRLTLVMPLSEMIVEPPYGAVRWGPRNVSFGSNLREKTTSISMRIYNMYSYVCAYIYIYDVPMVFKIYLFTYLFIYLFIYVFVYFYVHHVYRHTL